MRIVLDPATFDCLNMGDVAMLQVAVRRLRRRWPSANIEVFTSSPSGLLYQVDGVSPLDHNGRLIWFSDSALLGGLKGRLPRPMSEMLSRLNHRLRDCNPKLLRRLLGIKGRFGSADARAATMFLAAMDAADLYVVSGAITLTDKSKGHGGMMLNSLEMALDRGMPAMMFGQGIGPLHDVELTERAKAVLPRVDLIAVRERRSSPGLLESLGISSRRIVVTGDDAVELAYDLRSATRGRTIGVSLRIGPSSDVSVQVAAEIHGPLLQFAREKAAALTPLPIAHHKVSDDPEAVKALLAGYDDASDGGRELKTPAKVIEAAGKCRIVLAGAYHAAVFALSQGIPTVCLAYNAAYCDKFLGLADLFGIGCELVFIAGGDLHIKLASALDRAWNYGDDVRSSLLTAAASQIASSRRAHERASGQFAYPGKTVA